MRRLSSFTLAFLAFLFPATGWAGAPDAAGAAVLKEVLTGLVASCSSLAEESGQGVIVTGDIRVTPGEKHYAAVIPGVTLRSAIGFRLDVGDIAVNASPGTAPGEEDAWILSVALPGAMPVVDAAGDTVATLVVAGQKAAGVWSPSLGTFTRLDAEYSGLSLKMPGEGPYALSLGKLRGAINMVQDAPGGGTWSGVRLFMMEDLSAGITGKGEMSSGSVRIGRLQSRAELRGMSLDAAKRAKDKLRALSAAGADQQGEQAVAAMMESVAAFPGAYTARLEVTDAAAGYTQGEEKMDAAFARFVLNAEASGLRQDKGGFAVSLSVEGMKVAGAPPLVAGLIPGEARIDLRLENLPMKDLSGAFSGIVQGVSQGAGPAQEKVAAEVKSILAGLPGLLSSAGTQFTVGNTYLKAPDLAAALEGRLTADPASPLAVAGAATLSLEGFDELVSKYRQLAMTQPLLAQYMTGLIPFQLAGEVAKGPDDRSVRTYRFELTPDGKVMLNGADFSVVTSLFGREKPSSPPVPDIKGLPGMP